MLPLATDIPEWSSVVTLGNVASVVIVAAVILVVLRRELRSEWREAAESRGARIDDLEERIAELEGVVKQQAENITELKVENAELRSRPSLEQVQAALDVAAAERAAAGAQLARMSAVLGDVENGTVRQSLAAERQSIVLSELEDAIEQHVIPSLSSISTILVDLVATVHRTPGTRTRSTDPTEGAPT